MTSVSESVRVQLSESGDDCDLVVIYLLLCNITCELVVLLSPATKWKGDIGMCAVRPSFRPSRFVSGAEHKNREIYLNQTWYIDRSSGELVPFDSLGFKKKFFPSFHGNDFDLD